MCIRICTDATYKLGFAFQKDLRPDFSVFGFLNLTNLSNVTNSQKLFNPP